MELRFRVYDKRTSEDITHEFDWVITPDGKLHYLEYDDIPDATSFAYYEITVKRNGTWETIK